jgi:hypothetical protein
MAEFRRLLKPGGRVYVCTNSWGRWLFKAGKAFAAGDYSGAMKSLKALAEGSTPGAAHNYLELSQVEPFCEAHGFGLVGAAAEGCLDLTGQGRRRPMYAEKLLLIQEGEPHVELDANIEFVAERL